MSGPHGDGGGRSDLVDVAGEIRGESRSGKAWRFACAGLAGGRAGPRDGAREVWLPKSLVEPGDDGTVGMPEWLAHEKGLI